MDLASLIAAAPNLAFGFAALWYAREVHKERVAALDRYAASLEEINKLYMQLLERAISAIATNATQSADNGDALAKLLADVAIIRQEIGGLREYIDRTLRASTKRNTGNPRAPGSG